MSVGNDDIPTLAEPEIVSLGNKMPAFALPSAQGGTVNLAEYAGKKVLLIFPRGKVDNDWCQVCHYQYAELAELERVTNFRERHNLEIIFVLPYTLPEVKTWVTLFPHQMDVIESWKHPANTANLSEGQIRFVEAARKSFPQRFSYTEGSRVQIPFPVLADADRAVSKQLQIFRSSWEGSNVDQNQPTIFLLDSDGIVRFKYYSQSTFDRPAPEYLLHYVDHMLSEK